MAPAAAETVQDEHLKASPSPSPALLLLKVKRLSPNATLPSRASAGYDLSSAVETVVPARGRALVCHRPLRRRPGGHLRAHRICFRFPVLWKLSNSGDSATGLQLGTHQHYQGMEASG
nr:uncharacterized protein LOC127319765 [Lolium perenne]